MSRESKGRGRFVDLSADRRETCCGRCGRPWNVQRDTIEPIVCLPPRDDCSLELSCEQYEPDDERDRGELA